MISKIKSYVQINRILDKKFINKIIKKYDVEEYRLIDYIYPQLIREVYIELLCEVSTIPVEIYGDNSWKDLEQVKPFYKKELSYGDEIRKIYNESKYFFVVASNYLLNQRLFEGISSGSIPIVYDGRDDELSFDGDTYGDELLYFDTKDKLIDIINNKKEPKNSPKKVLDGNRYSDLANKIIDHVNQELNTSV